MDRLRLGKDYRKPVAELRRRGWTLTHTTGRHPKLTCPAGRHAIPVPTTSSGSKMLAGWHAEVRRHDRTCSE